MPEREPFSEYILTVECVVETIVVELHTGEVCRVEVRKLCEGSAPTEYRAVMSGLSMWEGGESFVGATPDEALDRWQREFDRCVREHRRHTEALRLKAKREQHTARPLQFDSGLG